MPLTHKDWNEIYGKIRSLIAQTTGEPFVQGEVIRRDPKNRLVWLEDFGDTPIPLFGFDYQVEVFFPPPIGGSQIFLATMLTPKIGETVLVAQHLGSSRLPKCLGVVHSTDFVMEEEI
jgi:hypothetical protein